MPTRANRRRCSSVLKRRAVLYGVVFRVAGPLGCRRFGGILALIRCLDIGLGGRREEAVGPGKARMFVF